MFLFIKDGFIKFIDVFNNFIFGISHSLVLPLRYKIEVRGLDCIDPRKGGIARSIVFLSNHTSHIDATIVATEIIKKAPGLSIWALDQTFKLPYLRWAARRKETIQVVKVPNIPERRSEKHVSNLHKLVTRTGDGLRKGKNFLIFPSGQCKRTPVEIIDGKSAVPMLIKQCPDVNIILVRITGLWGSRFSHAVKDEQRWATRSVPPWVMFWQTMKMLLLNGLFFIPKRKVLVEFMPVESDFPRLGTRMEIDRYLERKFNEKWGLQGEPLYRVQDYFWRKRYTENEYQTREYFFNLNLVPKNVRNAVVHVLADKAHLDCKEIDFNMSLGRDLGLDSLQIVQVLTELERRYDINRLVPEDLTTVGHLIAVVGKTPIACEVKAGLFHQIEDPKPLSTRLSQRLLPIKAFFRPVDPPSE